MQKYFKVLGLNETATDEEIEKAYLALKEKYSRERFLEGEIGNQAAKQLTKIETAYSEIKLSRKGGSADMKNGFDEVEELIKAGNVSLAQEKLDDITDRGAEWHYLQSVIFYKKNWLNESKKQLEIALNIEPQNSKYSQAYSRLKDKMEYNNRQYTNGYYGAQSQQQTSQQMGGTDTNGCVDFCLTWCCMNMLCNMCLNCR